MTKFRSKKLSNKSCLKLFWKSIMYKWGMEYFHIIFVTFYRKRSTFQNVWRQSSGTFCTWTLTSNVLKSTPFPIERHITWRFETLCSFSYRSHRERQNLLTNYMKSYCFTESWNAISSKIILNSCYFWT